MILSQKIKTALLLLLACSVRQINGQPTTSDYRFHSYDSVAIEQLTDDLPFEESKTDVKERPAPRSGTLLMPDDVRKLWSQMRQKKSYGETQAITPSYDIKIQFYRKGAVKHHVLVSLYTNNLFATFPLKVQRQGQCMCKGTGGYCCSKGGISKTFRKQLLELLEKYHLEVPSELNTEP